MAALITIDDVKPYIESSKLTITEIEPDIEETWQRYVLSKLGHIYDTSTWIDSDSTPEIIRMLLGGLYAFGLHERYYSENIESGEGVMTYGQRVKTEMFVLLSDIIEGRATLG